MPSPYQPLPHRQPPVPRPWRPPQGIDAEFEPAGPYPPPSPTPYPPTPPPAAGYSPGVYPPPPYGPAPARRGRFIGRWLNRVNVVALALTTVAFLLVLGTQLQKPPPWFVGSWVAAAGDVPQLDLASASDDFITGRLILNHPDGQHRLALPLVFGVALDHGLMFTVADPTTQSGSQMYATEYEGPGVMGLFRCDDPSPKQPPTATLRPPLNPSRRVATLVRRDHAPVVPPNSNPNPRR